LAEAQAHLDQQIARQQAKLDRRAARIAATGKPPAGMPPLPVDQQRDVIRARQIVETVLAELARAAAETTTTATTTKKTTATKKTATKTTATKKAGTKTGATKEKALVANTSDPQSRLMPTRRGFVQGYNAQVAVTADQLIVALHLSQHPNDMACFVPMMHAAQAASARLHETTANPDHLIGTLLADAGYASDANLTEPGPDRLIALGKHRDLAKAARIDPTPGPPPEHATPRETMDHRLRTDEGSHLYKRRGATVEPGIGNLKKLLDRFSSRGLRQATNELHLAATAFNLLKLYRATPA